MSKTFAALSGNVVINVIVAETIEDAELAAGSSCAEYNENNVAGIGYIYDSETGAFSAPVIETEPQENTVTE